MKRNQIFNAVHFLLFIALPGISIVIFDFPDKINGVIKEYLLRVNSVSIIDVGLLDWVIVFLIYILIILLFILVNRKLLSFEEKIYLSIKKKQAKTIMDLIPVLAESIYGNDTAYFLIRYGSSVRQTFTSKDIDYAIIAFPKLVNKKSLRKINTGHRNYSWSKDGKRYDITYCDYVDFLIGLIIGKPYEHSVVTDGNIEMSYEVERFYWDWAVSLKNNIVIDRDSLILSLYENDLKNKMQKMNDMFSIENQEMKRDYSISTVYSLASLFIQILELFKMKTLINTDSIYPLSKSIELLNKVSDVQDKIIYEKIIKFAKRIEIPGDLNEFQKSTGYFLEKMKEILDEKITSITK